MPAAALYRPSSMGLLKLEPGFRMAVQPVLNDSHLVDRPPGGELEAKASEPGRAADGPSGPYSEPTWFDAFWSVESMVVMTFWPDSKARSEAIMSVIAFTGSAPEPSSAPERTWPGPRSEEHTSELQSHVNLVCRLLLEKKKSRPHPARDLGAADERPERHPA